MLPLGINTPGLSNETLLLLRDIIYKRCGIFFPETKKYLLETRLSRRLEERNLKTFEDYYYFLTYDGEKDRELQSLLNTIVTNQTSFFRDGPQLDTLSKGAGARGVEEKSRGASRAIKL